MRYLLTPITMFIWYLLTYFALYFSIILMLYMFSLSWVWLIIGNTFLIGLFSALAISIPRLLNFLILKFYKLNWFSIITHSIAGLLGIVHFYYILYQNPPEFVGVNDSTPILKELWSISWLKTLFLLFPFIGLQLALLYQGILSPIAVKLEEEPEY